MFLPLCDLIFLGIFRVITINFEVLNGSQFKIWPFILVVITLVSRYSIIFCFGLLPGLELLLVYNAAYTHECSRFSCPLFSSSIRSEKRSKTTKLTFIILTIRRHFPHGSSLSKYAGFSEEPGLIIKFKHLNTADRQTITILEYTVGNENIIT